jgi:hypothetical protein
MLLMLLGQAHSGIVLLVERLEFAMKLVHGTNQLVSLPLQPLKRLGIYKCLSSGISHLLGATASYSASSSHRRTSFARRSRL